MGFLRMIGLVTAEEHAKVVTKLKTALIDLANEVEARERLQREFNSVSTERDKFRDQVRDTCARAEKAEKALAEATAAYDNEHSDLRSANDHIKGLRAQVSAAEDVIAGLKPDAQKWRDRAAREHARRTKTRLPAADSAPKTAPATGKPRTAIPAKVGKTASAKISGARPAKKGARK